MTLLLFYHGNSFESIYQSAGAISHVALEDQVQVIPSLLSGALRWKGQEKNLLLLLLAFITASGYMRMLLKQLSKHALTSLTRHPKPPPSRRDFLLSIGDGDLERGDRGEAPPQ